MRRTSVHGAPRRDSVNFIRARGAGRSSTRRVPGGFIRCKLSRRSTWTRRAGSQALVGDNTWRAAERGDDASMLVAHDEARELGLSLQEILSADAEAFEL